MNLRTRGKQSKDDILFGEEKAKQNLFSAVEDLSFLLSKSYGAKSAGEIVGNRYKLTARQQQALRGMSAGDNFVLIRKKKELKAIDLVGSKLVIDGFNLLIILETLLSDAYIFKGVDGCYRDLSSVHGSYKTIALTENIMKLVGETFNKLKVKEVLWVLDKPVSNSGKLKTMLYELSLKYNFNWEVILDFNPDKFLVECKEIVITSDAWILNNCTNWFNMVAYMLDENLVVSDNILGKELSF